MNLKSVTTRFAQPLQWRCTWPVSLSTPSWRYIRRQVQEFGAGVSRRMLLALDFFTIPDEAPSGPEDPRTEGNRLNFSGRFLNIGLSDQSRALQPAFALHY